MKNIKPYIFTLVITSFLLGSLSIFPKSVKAIPTLGIADDPDPCLNITGGLSPSSLTTVPVHDQDVVANTCKIKIATSAVKDKTVGNTVFGIPVPFTSWDSILKVAMKLVIQKLTDSTVNWINSGFDGNPMFITDPGKFFKDIGDNVAGQFIQGSDLSFLCTPFQAKIRLTLYNERFRSFDYQNQSQCTLSQIGVNLDSFYNDFSAGGWDGWFAMTQQDSNNPYGSYINAEIEMDRRISDKLGVEKLQADWNNGFLSTKDCVKWADLSVEETDNNAKPACLEYGPTKTPGSVIEGQLQGILGQGVTDLGLARSFDDVVGALVGALQKKIFTSASGLFTNNGSSGGSYSGSAGGVVSPISFGNGTSGTGTTGTNNPTNPTNPTSVITCSADKKIATLGEDVTWTLVNPLEGTPGVTSTYVWSGENVGAGETGTSVKVIYDTVGPKNASVTTMIIKSSQTPQIVTATCSPINVSNTSGGGQIINVDAI